MTFSPRSLPASASPCRTPACTISTRENQKTRERVLHLGISQDQRRFPRKRGRLLRAGTGGCALRTIRCQRHTFSRRSRALAHGNGLSSRVTVPPATGRHVPATVSCPSVKSGQSPELLPSECTDDIERIFDGLCFPCNKSDRRRTDRTGSLKCPERKSPRRCPGKSAPDRTEQPERFPFLIRF